MSAFSTGSWQICRSERNDELTAGWAFQSSSTTAALAGGLSEKADRLLFVLLSDSAWRMMPAIKKEEPPAALAAVHVQVLLSGLIAPFSSLEVIEWGSRGPLQRPANSSPWCNASIRRGRPAHATCFVSLLDRRSHPQSLLVGTQSRIVLASSALQGRTAAGADSPFVKNRLPP